MKKRLFILILTGCAHGLLAQVVTTVPAIPKPDEPVTITVDVSGTSLDHFAWNNETNPVYIWTWFKKDGVSKDAPTNVNPATAQQAAAKCNRISINPDKYQITFTPTTFFNAPAGDLAQIGIKLKSRDWNENKQTDNDRYFTLSQGFTVVLIEPAVSFLFKNQGDQISVSLVSSALSNVTTTVDGTETTSHSGILELAETLTVTESSGTHAVKYTVTSIATGEVKALAFTYTVRTATVAVSRPPGIIDGINYGSDPSAVTLSLWAPGKTSVYVIGDMTDWQIDAAHQMKKDGEHFWLQIDGLVSGTEYGFQYLVDESLKIADPYADKVLDPDDQYIPATTYPDLKPYPAKALNDQWYFNRVSILQTGQDPYLWQASGYQKPAAEKLVVYELLIRDFFDESHRNYQSLIDTITYLKRLGINAIELMPITEFNGNDSWGYNPTFMFAPDKYYGTKNNLKKFIDRCHQQGIVVILDIVMNHQDIPNAYAMMDFDFTAFKPTGANRWFNVNATHPYSVFFDLNHESHYTQSYLDTVNYYWLHEYKVDGFRYDLSKGFTQRNSGSDVNGWSSYDQSRIDILTRMTSKIRAHSPDAYVILEHFAANSEEVALAAASMMLWGNLNGPYSQNTMGYVENSDISWGYYKTRGWTTPRVVTYMESHDEERVMYDNLQYGNGSGTYSVKTSGTALTRMKAANLMFLTFPGPKLIWEFGELGYDQSINLCTDNTINSSCRVTAKPVHWDYQDIPVRADLFKFVSDLLRLRKTYPVFAEGDAIFSGTTSLIKQIGLASIPYTAAPSGPAQMNVQIAVNFDVAEGTAHVAFPHTGTWYEYYSHGKELVVNAVNQDIPLEAGAFKMFTDVPLENPLVTGLPLVDRELLQLYPNPVVDMVTVGSEETHGVSLTLLTAQGIRISPRQTGVNKWDVRELSSGMYVAEIYSAAGVQRVKMIKK